MSPEFAPALRAAVAIDRAVCGAGVLPAVGAVAPGWAACIEETARWYRQVPDCTPESGRYVGRLLAVAAWCEREVVACSL